VPESASGVPSSPQGPVGSRLKDPVAFFRDEGWTLGIIGLGYVGLPLAVASAQRGMKVIGFDVDKGKIDALNAGRSHVLDVADRELADVQHLFRATGDENDLAQADALVVCVPSPLGRNRTPDMSYLESAAAMVARVARPGQLIALESTTYPGSTEDLFLPAIATAGLELDKDVWIAFSPERIDPGNALGPAAIPKVVGGVSVASGDVASAAYQRLVDTVHTVSTARAAELTKLLENTYRSVNIALVNELAQLANLMDVDVWEVIDAAATKPFGFQAFRPGPGVGGHCIPLDPQYLAWRAREVRAPTRFIDLAQQVNDTMPAYVVERLALALNDGGLAIRDAKILGVGVAYKPNIGDDRESASIDVLEQLAARGADISVLDPHVPAARAASRGWHPVTDAEASNYDVALILTDHDGLDYEEIAKSATIVFDTRDAYRRRGIHRGNVQRL
jgi:UDP-N-acetyl-D-glucosamine dehydrogenase